MVQVKTEVEVRVEVELEIEIERLRKVGLLAVRYGIVRYSTVPSFLLLSIILLSSFTACSSSPIPKGEDGGSW